jgi:hypothetical protein
LVFRLREFELYYCYAITVNRASGAENILNKIYKAINTVMYININIYIVYIYI